MPEVRIDSLTGLRTIVAGERAGRPGAFPPVPPRPPIDPATDPFLEGHEDRTPPELYAVRPAGGAADGPGWTVRVVPNLYPAFEPGGPGTMDGGQGLSAEDPLASGRGEVDLFPSRPAVGAHEVIVNCPEPIDSLADLGAERMAAALEVWRDRMRTHEDAAYVHLIVNEGREAGASLPHTHAQLFALPFVPASVARERERFTAYAHRTNGRNLLEDVLQEEVRLRSRIVAIDSDAVAICPFASRVAFQMQIVPRRPRPRFEDDGPPGAGLLGDVLDRLRRRLGGPPPLNLWVRTAPRGAEYFCWRIDVLPRLAQPAGLELGTGLGLNVMPPERAAALLREPEAPGP